MTQEKPTELMVAGAHLWDATPLDRQSGTDRWPISQVGWGTSLHPWSSVSSSLVWMFKQMKGEGGLQFILKS